MSTTTKKNKKNTHLQFLLPTFSSQQASLTSSRSAFATAGASLQAPMSMAVSGYGKERRMRGANNDETRKSKNEPPSREGDLPRPRPRPQTHPPQTSLQTQKTLNPPSAPRPPSPLPPPWLSRPSRAAASSRPRRQLPSASRSRPREKSSSAKRESSTSTRR